MIKIDRVHVSIERAVTVAPYTVHKVRVGVEAEIPEHISYQETLESLLEVVGTDVDNALEREKLEYGGND